MRYLKFEPNGVVWMLGFASASISILKDRGRRMKILPLAHQPKSKNHADRETGEEGEKYVDFQGVR